MDSINKIIIFSTRFLGRLWQIWLEDQGKISWRRWAAATDETASKRWRTCHYHCRLHDRSSRIVTSSVPLRRWDKSGYGQYKWATRVRTYRTNYEQRKQSAVFLGHAQGKTNKRKITIKLRTICDFFIYFFFRFSFCKIWITAMTPQYIVSSMVRTYRHHRYSIPNATVRNSRRTESSDRKILNDFCSCSS